MAKIVSMSTGAIDPIAQTKRVFFRSTDSVTLAAGDAVCYKLDACDHKERGTGSTPVDDHLGGAGTTYAEGAQTYTGRLFNVEEPLIDNIDQFAGIVKSLGPKAGKDGDMIEIFKANSGAVVPVNLAASITTVVGRTLLAVVVGQRTLGCPVRDIPNFGITPVGSTDSKIVGIAMEVRTDAGKCWVKLDENMFTHQGGQIGQEFQIAAVADDVTVNKMNLNFLNTSGFCRALHFRSLISSTGHCGHGMYRFETFVKATHSSQTVTGLSNIIDLTTAFVMTSGLVVGFSNTVRSRSVNPNMTGSKVISYVSEIILTKTTTGVLDAGGPDIVAHFLLNADPAGTTPTHFLYADNRKFVPITAPHDIEADDVAVNSILIRVQGVDYHIPCYTDAEIGV